MVPIKKGLMECKAKEFEFDGVFLSIYSHLPKKTELSRLCGEKLQGSRNPLKSLLIFFKGF